VAAVAVFDRQNLYFPQQILFETEPNTEAMNAPIIADAGN
jgi:hypothetical protein